MKLTSIFSTAAIMLLASVPAMAQKTMDDMQYLTINENVTTVITASEPVRFVDISTDKQTRWLVTSQSTTLSVSNPKRVWTYIMMAMC